MVENRGEGIRLTARACRPQSCWSDGLGQPPGQEPKRKQGQKHRIQLNPCTTARPHSLTVSICLHRGAASLLPNGKISDACVSAWRVVEPDGQTSGTLTRPW